jgi:hypothetical protein
MQYIFGSHCSFNRKAGGHLIVEGASWYLENKYTIAFRQNKQGQLEFKLFDNDIIKAN